MKGVTGFIAPHFLWAALSALLVVLIHFLRRPKTISLAFPSLRFFSAAAVTATKSRSLYKWLLLLVRMLMITMLAIIFAVPYLKNNPLRQLSHESTSTGVWIDPSFGMEYIDATSTLYAKAAAFFDSLRWHLPPGRSVELYNEESGTFSPYTTKTGISAVVPQLITDPQRFFRAFSNKRSSSHKPVFLFLSDFQSPTTLLVDSLLALQHPSPVTIIAVPFTPQKPWNICCRQISLVSGTENVLIPRIVVDAEHPVTFRISVRLDNMKLPQTTITLPPRCDTTLYLPLPQHSTFTSGNIELLCDDPMQFDNILYFTSNDAHLPSVLITGDSLENRPLVAALASLDNRHQREISITPHLQLTVNAIHSADLIVVCGGDNSPFAENLIRKTHPAHPQVIIRAYDSLLASIPAHPSITWRSLDKPLSARLSDTLSSFWKGFPFINSTEMRIYGFASGLRGTPYLFTSGGHPLLTTDDSASNRLLISVATPLGISSVNNVCETGLYVPLIDRIFRMADQFCTPHSTMWYAGKLIRDNISGESTPLALLDKSGRHVMLLKGQKQFRTPPQGLYTLSPSKKTVQPLAINYDTLESILDYSLPHANTASSNELVIASPEQILEFLKSRRTSIEWLLPWLILGLLCLAELVVRMKLKSKIPTKASSVR